MQPALFPIEPAPQSEIPGLAYHPDYVSAEDGAGLLVVIDAQPWRQDLRRRVQHYGYVYDYRARAVSRAAYLGPLPDWLAGYAAALQERGVFPEMPDQVIVNEYQPGQGIAPHIDCEPCFTDSIASLSLGSGCLMDFAETGTGQKASLWLEPRSLLVLTGDARYGWTHGIAPRKSDKRDGVALPRTRRVSLTFRKVIL